MPEVVVVSTAYAPAPEFRRQCELSVLTQTIPVQHVYIDASVQGGTCTENVYNTVHNLDPETIVLWIDGDDWLASEDVVTRVLQEYKRGAWCTFGSFAVWRESAITPGLDAYKPTRPVRECRQDAWYASHLKTFRAGLFHQIKREDLWTPNPDSRTDSDWLTECVDLAIMWPLLEMADARARFIPEILYVYNYTNPISVHNSGDKRIAYQTSEARRLRTLKPYKKLGKAPW